MYVSLMLIITVKFSLFFTLPKVNLMGLVIHSQSVYYTMNGTPYEVLGVSLSHNLKLSPPREVSYLSGWPPLVTPFVFIIPFNLIPSVEKYCKGSRKV